MSALTEATVIVEAGNTSGTLTLLPDRLTWIDATNRDDHMFLREGDRCLFFGEYFSGKGYEGGGTNQLIFNFRILTLFLR